MFWSIIGATSIGRASGTPAEFCLWCMVRIDSVATSKVVRFPVRPTALVCVPSPRYRLRGRNQYGWREGEAHPELRVLQLVAKDIGYSFPSGPLVDFPASRFLSNVRALADAAFADSVACALACDDVAAVLQMHTVVTNMQPSAAHLISYKARRGIRARRLRCSSIGSKVLLRGRLHVSFSRCSLLPAHFRLSGHSRVADALTARPAMTRRRKQAKRSRQVGSGWLM